MERKILNRRVMENEMSGLEISIWLNVLQAPFTAFVVGGLLLLITKKRWYWPLPRTSGYYYETEPNMPKMRKHKGQSWYQVRRVSWDWLRARWKPWSIQRADRHTTHPEPTLARSCRHEHGRIHRQYGVMIMSMKQVANGLADEVERQRMVIWRLKLLAGVSPVIGYALGVFMSM